MKIINLLFGQKRSITIANVFDLLVHTRTSDHVYEHCMCP